MRSSEELKRLRWRCRRGMRELDAVLLRFVDTELAALSATERAAFAAVLELPDPQLYAYLLGRRTPEDPHVARIVVALKRGAHSKA